MNTINAFFKNLLIAGFAMLLPLMGPAQEKKTNSHGTLLFQSGFEPGTKLVHSGNGLTGDDDLIGTDLSVPTPNDWVKDIDENGNLGYFNLQYQGGDSTMRAARIIADPTNPKNHVLSFRATQPNVGEASKTRIQANIYAGKNKKTEGIKDFYQSIRIYLPRDMETLEEYPDKISWLTILEVWNNIQWVDDPYPYRITLGMGKPSGDKSRLHFMINAEDWESKTATSNGRYIKIWKEMNMNFDIPYEKWVTLEYYIQEGEGANGRFYMTATIEGGNKEVIFDIHNYMHNTRDPKPDGITLWNPMKLYTSKELTYFMKSKGKALQILWDDFSVWKNRIPQKSVSVKEITDIKHPRILLFAGEEDIIRKSVNASAEWKKMHEAILTESDRIITLPPVERIQIGRRLLDKSREALRRIFQLSYAYRMTGDNKYLTRAEKELLAVSNFTDWNPSHFLDVAEMTMAVSIGYDWLYNALPESSRKTIREAIVSKGLELSKNSKYNSWLRAEHNWNQVCNAGMTYGALAVAEDHPELAKEMIDKAILSIVKPMEAYNPDGAYPEGYGYWGYGTSFNTMFLSAVEKVFKDDFGLLDEPGYLKTGGFLQHMTGTTNLCFNWGDCGLRGGLNPTMFWLAQRNNDPTLLWVEKSYLGTDNYTSFTRDRLLPAVMIWGKDFNMNKVEVPKATAWMGQGANPVAMMRTSWSDPNAIYLGFKAGSASVNHGHMDIGSFIMESDGIRWASDFGSQDYESLESKGFSLFGRTQDAQRWTVFRLNNRVHNTLTVDDQLQLVKGFARIDKFSADKKFMYAISDISSVYGDHLGNAKRGAAIVDSKYVVIRDELTGGAKRSTIRWTMLTTATPEIKGNTIILTKDGKKLTLKVETGAKVTMKTWSTAPTTTYDAPNPGSVLVGFEFPIEAGTKENVEVYLVPGNEDANKIKFNKALQEW